MDGGDCPYRQDDGDTDTQSGAAAAWQTAAGVNRLR